MTCVDEDESIAAEIPINENFDKVQQRFLQLPQGQRARKSLVIELLQEIAAQVTERRIFHLQLCVFFLTDGAN